MPLFISVKKVLKFPNVIGRVSNPSKLWRMLKKKTLGRVPPGGAAVPRQSGQIDIQSIPGVPQLRKNGRKK